MCAEILNEFFKYTIIIYQNLCIKEILIIEKFHKYLMCKEGLLFDINALYTII